MVFDLVEPIAGTGALLCRGDLRADTHPWLAGKPLPTAVLTELLALAGAEAGCPHVRELREEAELVLPKAGGVRFQLRVGALENGMRAVHLYTRNSDDWVRHATGVLEPGTEAEIIDEDWHPRAPAGREAGPELSIVPFRTAEQARELLRSGQFAPERLVFADEHEATVQVLPEVLGSATPPLIVRAGVVYAMDTTEIDVDEPIVVIGASGRFPGEIGPPPEDRGWDVAPRGAFLAAPGDFDAAFFGMTAEQALVTDPQQRLLLETAWEAFENAGIDPERMRGEKVGVFAGVDGRHYESLVWAASMDVPAGPATAAVRLAQVFGLAGPAVETGDACRMAVDSLRRGDSAVALAGWATVLATPDALGESPAEGAGIVVLAKLSEAERRGCPVLATVPGRAESVQALIDSVRRDSREEPAEPIAELPMAWPLSAKTEAALRARATQLLSCVDEDAPADLGFSLARSTEFAHRAVVIGEQPGEFRDALKALAEGRAAPDVITGEVAEQTAPVLVFPGGELAWENNELLEHPVFAERIADCERALSAHVDWSLTELLHNERVPDRVDVVLPVRWAVQVAVAALWEAFGVRPSAVVGHGDGEIAAAVVSGALSLVDGAKVAALRARALRGIVGRGGMVAVSLPEHEVVDRIGFWPGRVGVAAIDSPESVLVTGDATALDELMYRFKADRIRVRRLPVEYAAHSSHVEEIEQLVKDLLADVVPGKAAVPFFSTVTGDWFDTTELTADYWYWNLRQPVLFEHALRALADQGCVFAEAADPGGTRQFLTAVARLNLRGAAVEWGACFPGGRRVELPTYPFQRERYWIDLTRSARPDCSGSPASAARSADHTAA
ncbi:acyltransferase domain-containing protein [Amycolatopsis magusensis]|uniref:acyltransferase domain-containing protein n=1 Tax=Amycolatopsis magusensis TaxID=882444 RepID=UPI003C2F9B62